MSWHDRKGVVLRGHNTATDPTAAGYREVIIAVDGILPIPVPIGDPGSAVGGVLDNRTLIRWEYDVEPLLFSTRYRTDEEYQSYGVYLSLVQVVTMQNVWLYETRSLIDVAGTPIERAPLHNWNAVPIGSFWNDPADVAISGPLPIHVVLDGEIRPERAPGGLLRTSFTLKKRTIDFGPQ